MKKATDCVTLIFFLRSEISLRQLTVYVDKRTNIAVEHYI